MSLKEHYRQKKRAALRGKPKCIKLLPSASADLTRSMVSVTYQPKVSSRSQQKLYETNQAYDIWKDQWGEDAVPVNCMADIGMLTFEHFCALRADIEMKPTN